jgi:signal transduction histidine kinase
MGDPTRRRATFLVAAAVLFAAIALLAVELGPWVGLAAAVGALALLVGVIGLLAARRQAAARELEAANAELRRSNAELADFAHEAAHDLQAPLAVVSGFASLLRTRYSGRLDAEAEEFLDYLSQGTTEMQALIDGLLEFAQVGKAQLDRREVDCGQVLADVLDELRPAIEETDAQVTANGLPIVRADPRQLHQVFANLMSNAIRFSSGAPRVVVEAMRENGGWQLSVRDHGVGVPPAEVERIFEPLYCAHRGPSGSGIGLAICSRVIERHGGRIWVEPAQGGGSVFRFTLPDAGELA